MKILLMSLVLGSFSAYAANDPYKIVILTDADAKVRAEEFKTYLGTKPPFNKMGDKLVIELVTMPAEEMNCANNMPNSPRIIRCNTKNLASEQAKANANFSVAFTSKGSGGAGGGIPIASLDYPIQTMFHEMLHTYGFADEYSYSAEEQTVYCMNPKSRANVVYFKDDPSYADDPAARTRHNAEVPWMGGIEPAKLIISGSALGSPEEGPVGSQNLGIFRGGSCDNAKLPGWRPYGNSIMRGYEDDTIYPFYEKVIVKNIEGAIGYKMELSPPAVKCLPSGYNLEIVNDLHDHLGDAVNKLSIPHNHKH